MYVQLLRGKRKYYFCTAPCTFIGYIPVTDSVEKDLWRSPSVAQSLECLFLPACGSKSSGCQRNPSICHISISV